MQVSYANSFLRKRKKIMFSDRTNWKRSPNRIAQILQAKKDAEETIYDLTESNPTRAGLQYEESEILQAISAPGTLVHEPAPFGHSGARQAVASYYQEMGRQISPESILLTASTSEAYSYLFKLLINPGEELLTPQPSYPLLEFLTALESVSQIPYPLNYSERDGWKIDLGMLEASISTNTRAILYVNPNNPTGSFLKKGELDAISRICVEFGLALIIDEVFLDYGWKSHAPGESSVAGNTQCLTFVLSGLSKIAALPQLKLGWMVISGPSKPVEEAVARLEYVADSYLSVSATVQQQTKNLLDTRFGIQKQIRARVRENLRYLEDTAQNAPFLSILRGEGGWYAVVHIKDGLDDEERVYRLLKEENVYVHPGYFYDFRREGVLVISLLAPEAVFQEGVARLKRLSGRHRIGE